MGHKILSLFLVSLLFAPTLLAQEGAREIDKQVSAISGEVLSPFCPGRTLNDCPSSAASDLKKEIRKKLAEGLSKEQVFEYLYTVYGEEIRAAPEFASFGLVAWLTPFLFLLLGFGAIVLWLRRNRANASVGDDEEVLF